MLFDRESTIVITKLSDLSESLLTAYCEKFGTVIRCLIKKSHQSQNKDPFALVKFAEASSVTSILNHRHHIIDGLRVIIRSFHQDTNINRTLTQSLPSLMSITQSNPALTNSNTTNNKKSDGPMPMDYDQILQENQALKYEIANLQKSLVEAQTYSKTAYDTFQILREKYEAEQTLSNKLKGDYATMVESYEARLKEMAQSSGASLVTASNTIFTKDKVKEEPIDNDNRADYLFELQIIKDHLEQAQIDLGKCQTENTLLNAKLISREQQFDKRYKELNSQYIRVKKQYEHVTSCIKDFHAKLYPRKRLKTDSNDDGTNKSNQINENKTNDSNDEVVEIIMQVEPMMS